jgi:hypothetical protein
MTLTLTLTLPLTLTLKNWDNKIYGLESRGTETRAGLWLRGPAATVNYRPVLSSERALQNNKPATV